MKDRKGKRKDTGDTGLYHLQLSSPVVLTCTVSLPKFSEPLLFLSAFLSWKDPCIYPEQAAGWMSLPSSEERWLRGGWG